MPRVARGRTEYLTREEIARAALDQFDTSERALSMRGLAKSLGASPTTIYHHYSSEEEIIRAAVGLVLLEAITDFTTNVGNPLVDDIDPEEFFVNAAVFMRRAFMRHYRIAPYLASSPEESGFLAGVLALFGAAFEKMGVSGERAGEATWTWGHYVYGSIVLSASTRLADERFHTRTHGFSTENVRPADAPVTKSDTAASIDRTLDIAGDDDAEAPYFLAGLHVVLAGIKQLLAEGSDTQR